MKLGKFLRRIEPRRVFVSQRTAHNSGDRAAAAQLTD